MTEVVASVAVAQRATSTKRLRRPQVGSILSYGYLLLLVFVAITSRWIAPFPVNEQDPANALQGPSSVHWLGTDDVGRDVLARLMYATAPALEGIVVAMVVTTALGLVWGLVAGHSRGLPDVVLMRTADILLSFPSLILAMAITAALGINLRNAMIALGIAHAPSIARIVRAGVLGAREREFVRITQIYGQPRWYAAIVHVLPNVFAPVLVQLVIFSGLSLLSQTSLSFIGLGDPPPAPGWGDSLASAYQYILTVPTATLAPGIVVALAVLSIHRVGDDLRDRLAAGYR